MNIRVKMSNYNNCRALGVQYLDSVHVMDIEEYLKYVVPAEMKAGSFPAGALQAQAIASRSYAMYHMNKNKNNSFDVIDVSSSYQAMHVNMQHANSDAAVNATSGQIRIYNGAAAQCCFCHANDGTQKAAHEKWPGEVVPYLPRQVDQWTRNANVPGDGHGVGMSQEGCKWAINNGYSIKQVLDFYYPGTTAATNYNGLGGGGSTNPGGSGYATWDAKYGPNTFVTSNSYSGNVYRFQVDMNKWLRSKGYATIAEDGKWGSGSAGATLKFQQYYSDLVDDGLCGPATKRKLFDLYGR